MEAHILCAPVLFPLVIGVRHCVKDDAMYRVTGEAWGGYKHVEVISSETVTMILDITSIRWKRMSWS